MLMSPSDGSYFANLFALPEEVPTTYYSRILSTWGAKWNKPKGVGLGHADYLVVRLDSFEFIILIYFPFDRKMRFASIGGRVWITFGKERFGILIDWDLFFLDKELHNFLLQIVVVRHVRVLVSVDAFSQLKPAGLLLGILKKGRKEHKWGQLWQFFLNKAVVLVVFR